MTDPDRGGCVPALGTKAASLLLDPTVEQARAAFEQAFQLASKDESTLFLHLIGHGHMIDRDFYFLPLNATIPPKQTTSPNIVQMVKEPYLGGYLDVEGLVVLIDTCFSGAAAAEAAQKWIFSLDAKLRFEVLTAAGDRPAADGCFTRTLIDVCKRGNQSAPWENVRCKHLRSIAEKSCKKQVPQHNSYNPDPGLFVSKNTVPRKSKLPWMGTRASSQIERLTSGLQIARALSQLVRTHNQQRLVFLLGEAGSGKSSLAATLAYPKAANGMVPGQFIHAIVFLTEATGAVGLSNQLAE